METILKNDKKYFLLSAIVAFIVTQLLDNYYGAIIAGFWLGFWLATHLVKELLENKIIKFINFDNEE